VDEPAEGILTITFDDGYDEQIEAARLMARHGFRGTAYVMPDQIGTFGYLRLEDLRTLRDELGWDVRDLKLKSLTTHLGVDSRDDLEQMWGTKVWDGYGSNECGAVAVYCEHRTGMHVFEDGFVVEINDPDTGRPVAHGERGNIFLTALWKQLGPVIRYNTNDVSAIIPGACPCGGTPVRR